MNEDELTLLAKMFASKNVMEGHRNMTFVFHDFDGFNISITQELVIRFELRETGIDSRLDWLGTESRGAGRKEKVT
jgi:hypothetical protein